MPYYIVLAQQNRLKEWSYIGEGRAANAETVLDGVMEMHLSGEYRGIKERYRCFSNKFRHIRLVSVQVASDGASDEITEEELDIL